MNNFSVAFDKMVKDLQQKIYSGPKPWKAGWPVTPANASFDKIDSCEALISFMPSPPSFKNEGDIAIYKREIDTVVMPDPLLFISNKNYYATLFHEMSHSTAHENRLNRPPLPGPDSIIATREKAKEEIIAELSATFLCGSAGIITDTFENHAAFIKSWIGPVLFDFVLFQQLALKAKAAAAYILQVEWVP